MTAKIQITDAFKSGWNNDWHLQAAIGPFRSREEANEFAKKIMALAPQDEAPPLSALGIPIPAGGGVTTGALVAPQDEAPPPLGVNVSETIAMKDRFG